MKPVVICFPTNLPKEIEAIHQLFEHGLKILHVRKPSFNKENLQSFIYSIDKKYHDHIVVHSHLSLAEEMGLKGVHFTSYNRHLIDEYSRKELQRSISVHSTVELAHVGERFSYAFISPVFESITKVGYKPIINADVLQEQLKKIHDVPVLALAGIEPKNLGKAHAMGFDGVVLHGHLWAQFEKDQNVGTLIERFEEVNSQWKAR